MTRVHVLRPAQIAALLEAAVARCPAELFRPYRYRDPERAGDERMAELKLIDLRECGFCRSEGWPCEEHQPGLSA